MSITNEGENIFGSFLSYPSLMYDAAEEDKRKAKQQGDLYHQYVWGGGGIDTLLKELKHKNYGNDLLLILFQFYLNPFEGELEVLKELESYRKKEKAIGVPIIVTNENFFDRSEEERWQFLKESVLHKLDLLAEVVRKKKLDTNMNLLRSDVKKFFEQL